MFDDLRQVKTKHGFVAQQFMEENDILFEAIEDGKFKLAKILIAGLLGTSCRDSAYGTPLTVVCRVKSYKNEKERLDFVKFLLKEGARYDEKDFNDKSAIDYAVENDLYEIKDLFVEKTAKWSSALF